MKNEEAMLNLDVYSVAGECILDPNIRKHFFLSVNNSTYNIVHDIFKLRKFQYDFGDFFTVYSDGEEIISSIRPSYDEFISFLSLALNTNLDKTVDDERFELVCRERIQVLSQITSIEELASEFPIIYQDYIQGREYIQGLRHNKNNMSNSDYAAGEHYFYSCALRYSLDNFIPSQVTLYKRFLNNRREYLNRIKRVNANRYLRENVDMSRLTMLVVLNYIEICENTDDYASILKYLPLIKKYIFSSDIDYSCSIRDKKGHIITLDEIVVRYSKLCDKVNNRERLVNWELIPDGCELFKVVQENGSARRTSMSSTEVLRLKAIGEEKTRYYENSGYYLRVIGKMKYKGYIAYIYSNGEVILDYEYNSDIVSSASGNAIYHMSITDFLALSGEDKGSLRDNPRVERIIHSKNWMDRVNSIITREGTEEELQKVKEFAKRI